LGGREGINVRSRKGVDTENESQGTSQKMNKNDGSSKNS
jgi:hypothetical protein